MDRDSPSFQPPGPPPTVSCEAAARIPSAFGGTHRLHIYSNSLDDKEHLALVFGPLFRSASLDAWRPNDSPESRAIRGAIPSPIGSGTTNGTNGTTNGTNSTNIGTNNSTNNNSSNSTNNNNPPYESPIVRIHSCCFTGETLGSLRCDCAEQLHQAIRSIAAAGSGIVLYLAQEGRGIGLKDKLLAYNLIDMGHDTLSANIALGHPPDARSYDIASAILADLGVSSIRLLTNNPLKIVNLQNNGIHIIERIPMIPSSWQRRLFSDSPSSTPFASNNSHSLNGGIISSTQLRDSRDATSTTSTTNAEDANSRIVSSSQPQTIALPSPALAPLRHVSQQPQHFTSNGSPAASQDNPSHTLTDNAHHHKSCSSSKSSSNATTSALIDSTQPAPFTSATNTNNNHTDSSSNTSGSVDSASTPSVNTSSCSDADITEIQDRDGYLVTKIMRMGHILDIPDSILRSVSTSSPFFSP